MLAEAQEAGKILDEEQHAFLVDPGVPDGQVVQTIIPNNASLQTKDLDTYDSNCDDISNAQAVLMANISNYGSDVISDVPHSETYLNDMLNRLTEDFGKRFTPQQELLVEQALQLRMSDPTSKPSDALPIKIEPPKELLKISLVIESLKKLKFHLAKFHNVVKIRTTPNACIKGEWGFKHTKDVFNNEIIPFLKSLKEIFNVFDRDLLNEILEIDLKAQLQDKDSTICKLKDMIKSMRENSKDENVKYDYCEIETKNVELEYRKEIVDIAAQIPSTSTIVPGMFKLDLEPLAPRVMQNQDVHIKYLKYAQEQADIRWGIVKQARAKQPLDKELDFAKHVGIKRLHDDLGVNTAKITTVRSVSTVRRIKTRESIKMKIVYQDYLQDKLRVEQYFQVQDYALWDVIENGNSFKPVPQTTTNSDGSLTSLIPGPVTTKENVQKKNDVKAGSMLLMALPNEHLMTFNQYKDAKTLFAAIQTRFGSNEAIKKTHKTLLKQISGSQRKDGVTIKNFSTVSALKLSVLRIGEYDLWSMKMEQYLTLTNHALWEVIVNGDLVSPVASANAGAEGPIPPKTAEQKLARKNELKAKSTLMLAIPDEHLLKFHAFKDAKSLWEAIKNSFGGNKESKKMQKTILK
ncbi:hypothetical protein Tco_0750711 [Tanacetum coccineum]|uniref:Uncharacterized protein n=1 Tax=Tanacetum coccineum TaxID=301880 RepID=A0ABQ4Z2Y1_9ASTR